MDFEVNEYVVNPFTKCYNITFDATRFIRQINFRNRNAHLLRLCGYKTPIQIDENTKFEAFQDLYLQDTPEKLNENKFQLLIEQPREYRQLILVISQPVFQDFGLVDIEPLEHQSVNLLESTVYEILQLKKSDESVPEHTKELQLLMKQIKASELFYQQAQIQSGFTFSQYAKNENGITDFQ